MMPEHLQGEGSYTYDCRKADCEHCRLLGLAPLPEIKVEVEKVVIDVVYECAPPRKLKPIRAKKEKPPQEKEPKKEKWLPEKLEYLLNNYQRLNNIDLSIKLHLSRFLISKKMTELGLTRTARINMPHVEREENVLSNNYGGWF